MKVTKKNAIFWMLVFFLVLGLVLHFTKIDVKAFEFMFCFYGFCFVPYIVVTLSRTFTRSQQDVLIQNYCISYAILWAECFFLAHGHYYETAAERNIFCWCVLFLYMLYLCISVGAAYIVASTRSRSR